MSTILDLQNLTKTYGSKKALDHLNLKLESGRIIGLLGPNGSGKTTLLKLINRLLTVSDGRLLIDGKEPGIETKSVVAYLPERTFLATNLRIRQILDYFSDFYKDFDRSRAEAMLQTLGLSLDARIKTLSKGSREKVQLVLVMSRRAKLYCLDEPIAGVDPAAREFILNTILNNYDENATILISTHLISDVENILDEVIFLQDGRIRMHESVEDIRSIKRKSVDELFREVFQC